MPQDLLRGRPSLRATSHLVKMGARKKQLPPLHILATLLLAKGVKVQNGDAGLERGLPVMKPIWPRICGQTSKTVRAEPLL